MLKSLKHCLSSAQQSAITLIHQHKIIGLVKKICKSKPKKRAFHGFEGMKSSFASMHISRQLELVFKFIDANGDGKISPLELSEFLKCLGHDKSKVAEEVDGIIRHLDANGDGFVDLNEYMDVFMMMDDGDHDNGYDGYNDDDGDNYDHHHYYNGGFEDDLMDAFLVFDIDKNGLISARELHLVLKRLGFANCSIKECNRMIKGVDRDGDGFVNFEEFRVMMMGFGN